MNLLALHTIPVDPTAARTCICLRAACGGAESGPGTYPSGCGAHGTITVQHHRAVDCPALPADTDLSALWLIVTTWTGNGPRLDRVLPYSRSAHAELRAAGAMWDLATGASPEDAGRQWQDHVDAARADSARQQAEEIAAVRRRAWLREQSLNALRDSGRRAARRSLNRGL